MTRRNQDSRIVHHTFVGYDDTAVVTTLTLQKDGFVQGSAFAFFNTCVPTAMRLRRVAVRSVTIAETVAGAWTLHLGINEGADVATFSVSMPVGGAKQSGQLSADVVIQAGDTYHLDLDGPSRNLAFARVTLEWEVL